MSADWLTADVVTAVARHMNADHAGDTLTMVKPLRPNATAAVVIGLDAQALHVSVESSAGAAERVDLPWPGPLTQRADIRRFVVELHDAACEQLGIRVAADSDHDHSVREAPEGVG